MDFVAVSVMVERYSWIELLPLFGRSCALKDGVADFQREPKTPMSSQMVAAASSRRDFESSLNHSV